MEQEEKTTNENQKPVNDDDKQEILDVRKVITRKDQKLNDVDDEVKPLVVNETNDPLVSRKEFTELGLSEKILEGVYFMKYNKPSKIQGLAIPAIISNPPKNFIGQAQSGTGKTAAFLLSMLARIDDTIPETQALCVAPTRELVRQIFDVATNLAKFTQVKIALNIPEEKGTPVPKAYNEHLIIGTPGKMYNFISSNKISVNNIKMLVLDEADEMLDSQGHQNQTIKIKRVMPKSCQVCLFSATYNDEIQAFAKKIVLSPKISILIPPAKLSLEGLYQFYINCENEDHKYTVLNDIYGWVVVGQSIIFTESRIKARQVYQYMKDNGHEVSLLHGGDMPPTQRDNIIDDFRNGRNRVLVTTNLLSRGVDVLNVSMVINFDLPLLPGDKPDAESYLHRIGRSGRYGKPGIAINLIQGYKSKMHLEHIEHYFKKNVAQLDLAKKEDQEELDKISKKLSIEYN